MSPELPEKVIEIRPDDTLAGGIRGHPLSDIDALEIPIGVGESWSVGSPLGEPDESIDRAAGRRHHSDDHQ